jgi:DNA-directed RNA polymerase sigma subunit (sigma70/sigma32)
MTSSPARAPTRCRCSYTTSGATPLLSREQEIERQVVKLRYGINGNEPTPLVETGRRLGISQDTVRRLERKALSLLAESRELDVLRPAA